MCPSCSYIQMKLHYTVTDSITQSSKTYSRCFLPQKGRRVFTGDHVRECIFRWLSEKIIVPDEVRFGWRSGRAFSGGGWIGACVRVRSVQFKHGCRCSGCEAQQLKLNPSLCIQWNQDTLGRGLPSLRMFSHGIIRSQCCNQSGWALLAQLISNYIWLSGASLYRLAITCLRVQHTTGCHCSENRGFPSDSLNINGHRYRYYRSDDTRRELS